MYSRVGIPTFTYIVLLFYQLPIISELLFICCLSYLVHFSPDAIVGGRAFMPVALDHQYAEPRRFWLTVVSLVARCARSGMAWGASHAPLSLGGDTKPEV
ncbi:hypothetical protein HAX54_035576 [Datura stramonium]|uniref:Uncharacterized protein n=1 Tax=Datura stramonium TaxID=4076 RepID=A0ABS8VGL5_DATST|nr:hypothetical protein [Datura stramonium]